MYLNCKVIAITVKNIDIDPMSAISRQNLSGYLRNRHIHQGKEIPIIGITIHSTVVTIMENMDKFQRITSKHI